MSVKLQMLFLPRTLLALPGWAMCFLSLTPNYQVCVFLQVPDCAQMIILMLNALTVSALRAGPRLIYHMPSSSLGAGMS